MRRLPEVLCSLSGSALLAVTVAAVRLCMSLRGFQSVRFVQQQCVKFTKRSKILWWQRLLPRAQWEFLTKCANYNGNCQLLRLDGFVGSYLNVCRGFSFLLNTNWAIPHWVVWGFPWKMKFSTWLEERLVFWAHWPPCAPFSNRTCPTTSITTTDSGGRATSRAAGRSRPPFRISLRWSRAKDWNFF